LNLLNPREKASKEGKEKQKWVVEDPEVTISD